MPTANELFALAGRYAAAGPPARAEPLLCQAVALDPGHVPSLYRLGVLAYEAGRAAEAADWFARAVERRPSDPCLFSCLGAAQQALGRPQEAARWHRRALELRPDDPQALNNLGISLVALGQREEAAALFRRVTELQPGDAGAWSNLGAAQRRLGRLQEATACYRKALERDPGLAQARLNLGNLHLLMGLLDTAEADYREALRLWRGPGLPWAALGRALLAQARPAEGRACLLAALEADPADFLAHSSYLGALLFDPDLGPDTLAAEHRRWAQRHAPAPPEAPPRRALGPGDRLRIGYVSPDLRRHAVDYFIEPVLTHHDRARVEVFCYAEVEAPDDVTARLRGLAEHWRDTAGLTDEAVADLVRRDGIDVLVDLAGHTTGNRLLVFARRPAPVQVSYLGYPHATGLVAIPFLIGDAITDPEGEPTAGGKAVVRLPGCFCGYAPPQGVAPSPGLPEDQTGRVTFIALHKLEKLNDAVLDLWARILEAVVGSRLLLARDSLQGRTAERLAGRFTERGMAPERVVLERVSAEGQAHLRAYDRGDVALDAFPWNGHTTACEALWMGVPVVALRGGSHAARMTASVLECLGLGDLVADTPADYVRVAAALAADRARRAGLREGLRQRMLASPLCDGAGLARRLEEVHTRLWQGAGA